jgi:hypothetical protein
MIKESAVNRSLSKRGLLVLIGILASAFWVTYVTTQPQLEPGQKPLTDLNNIETLRRQFNRDAGMIRLVILVAPT